MDLKLSNYSTTAAMNGSIASANNATLATVAANYGLKTVVTIAGLQASKADASALPCSRRQPWRPGAPRCRCPG